ncbi:MAG: response regulator [Victivallales bacterium]|nr:response regulator [Victivallales bacterium]MCF7889376.1 response regulator [Victivallales bacterium]
MRDNKYVILCVDDDQDVRNSLKFILEQNGYIMEEASSAEEGIKKFKQCSPDLTIVDLMMEEVDAGVNFVKEVRLLSDNVPVYMLSSIGDNLNDTVNYTELGLNGIFQKPINPQTLLNTIKNKL